MVLQKDRLSDQWIRIIYPMTNPHVCNEIIFDKLKHEFEYKQPLQKMMLGQLD